MNTPNFDFYYFDDAWGQYVDIELNYPAYISGPFPFSTSNRKKTMPVLKPKNLTLAPNQVPISSQFKNYSYDIEANYPVKKEEYNKFTEKNINLKGLESNINITTCITVSIITYIIFFIS